MAELERCPSDKVSDTKQNDRHCSILILIQVVWFLAPTVLLCDQQCEVIRLEIPSVSVRLLTGNENIETWSQQIWDTIISNTRIVVSTPQVLYDGLTHSFIKMSQLALLVFDEGQTLHVSLALLAFF